MMNSARAKSALDNLETATLSQDHVLRGHSHVGKGQVTVAMGRIVVSVDLEHSVDLDSGGGGLDKNNRLLLVRVLVVGVRLAHDDVDAAPGVTSTT